MLCRIRGIRGFLGTSWVLITMASRNDGRKNVYLVHECMNVPV